MAIVTIELAGPGQGLLDEAKSADKHLCYSCLLNLHCGLRFAINDMVADRLAYKTFVVPNCSLYQRAKEA